MHSPGLQNQQKKLCWDELDQLVKQEQQLLRQENERLQREVQSAKLDLAHSREKVNWGALQIHLGFLWVLGGPLDAVPPGPASLAALQIQRGEAYS